MNLSNESAACAAIPTIAPADFGTALSIGDGLAPARLISAADIDKHFAGYGVATPRRLTAAWAAYHGVVEVEAERGSMAEAVTALRGRAARTALYRDVS